MISKFPLQWPAQFKRTDRQKRSPFKITSLDTVRRGVQREIKLLGGINVIISSNIPVRNDGELYATMRPQDGDHGVAVYFTVDRVQRVLACDSYLHIKDNLRAIELSIEGIRRFERYGLADATNAVFTGFKALPENAGPSSSAWWDILQVDKDATPAEIKASWRRLIKLYHPDTGVEASPEKFRQVQEALKQSNIT